MLAPWSAFAPCLESCFFFFFLFYCSKRKRLVFLTSLAKQRGFRLAALVTTCLVPAALTVCLCGKNAIVASSGHSWNSSLSNGEYGWTAVFLFFFFQNHPAVRMFDTPELDKPHIGPKVDSMWDEHKSDTFYENDDPHRGMPIVYHIIISIINRPDSLLWNMMNATSGCSLLPGCFLLRSSAATKAADTLPSFHNWKFK